MLCFVFQIFLIFSQGFQRLAELIKDEQREIKSNGHIKSNEH